jgi:phage gp36-like protein
VTFFCTKANVEVAVGGVPVLVSLLDKNRDGVADADQVDAVLRQATAEVSSAIQIAVSLTALTEPYPDALVFNTARIAAYYAWLQSSSGQAVPQHIRDSHQDALRWLDQVAHGERTLGMAPTPMPTEGVGEVDINPRGDRVTRDSLAGFW